MHSANESQQRFNSNSKIPTCPECKSTDLRHEEGRRFQCQECLAWCLIGSEGDVVRLFDSSVVFRLESLSEAHRGIGAGG